MSDHEHIYAEELCIECGSSSLMEIATLRAEVASLRDEVEHLKSWQARAQKAHPGCAALDDLQGECRCEVASLRAALGSWQTLNVECFIDGTPAPRTGCECNTCETWREGDAALAGRGPEARGDYDPACTICRTERRKCSACAKPSPDVRGPFVPVTRVGDGLSDTFVRLSHLRGLLEAVDAVGERWERNPDLPVPRQFMVALAAKRKEWP